VKTCRAKLQVVSVAPTVVVQCCLQLVSWNSTLQYHRSTTPRSCCRLPAFAPLYTSPVIRHWRVVRRWLIMCSVMSLCLCVINFYKQDNSKTNLWIITKFVADTPYMRLWKWLTFGADHIQDSCKGVAHNLLFLYDLFNRWRKWHPLANCIMVTVYYYYYCYYYYTEFNVPCQPQVTNRSISTSSLGDLL